MPKKKARWWNHEERVESKEYIMPTDKADEPALSDPD
jgi:hypothetical protein